MEESHLFHLYIYPGLLTEKKRCLFHTYPTLVQSLVLQMVSEELPGPIPEHRARNSLWAQLDFAEFVSDLFIAVSFACIS